MKEHWSKRTTELQLSALGEVIRVSIRPLTPDELQQLLQLARRTGWYGNPDLIQFVLSSGIVPRAGEERPEFDVFAESRIAREVWIKTLKELRRVNRRLHLAESSSEPVPSVHSYKFKRLATPGLLTLISEDIRYFDSRGYLKEIARQSIAAVGNQKRPLTGRAKNAWITRNLEKVPDLLLWANKVNTILIDGLPESLFPTKAERYVAAERLIMTLDWGQYHAQLVCFNKAVHRFVFRSNQLGGLHVEFEDSVLSTGIPMILGLLGPESTLPSEVRNAFLRDLRTDKLTRFSRYRRRQIRRLLRESAIKFRDPLQENPDSDEIPRDFIADFFAGVQRYPAFVREICLAYPESFSKVVRSRIQRQVSELRHQFRVGRTPACRVFVEGESDVTILWRCIEILGVNPNLLNLDPCGGKQGVLARFRQVIKSERWYVGGLAAVFDGDAADEAADAERVARRRQNTIVSRYENGEIEDQFSASFLCRVVNELYPFGAKVIPRSIPSGSRKLSALRRELWRKKKTALNKTELARALADNLHEERDIPKEIKRIVGPIVQLAEDRRAAVQSTTPAHLL